MKQQNKIDSIFREKLYNYKAEHPQHLWAGIEKSLSALEKTGSTFKRIYLFLGTALGFLTVAGLLWYFGTGSEIYLPNPAASVHLEKHRAPANDNYDVNTALKTPVSDQQGDLKQVAVNEAREKTEGKTTSSISVGRKETAISSQTPTQMIRNTAADEIGNVSSELAFHTTKTGVTAQTLKTNVDDTRVFGNTDVRTDIDNSGGTAQAKQTGSEKLFYNESGQKLILTDQKSGFASNISEEFPGFSNPELIPVKHLLSYRLPLISSFQPNTKITLPQRYWRNSDDCMDMVEKPFKRQYIEVLSGPVKAKRLFYTVDSNYQNNVALRNQSEKVESAYYIGMRYVWNINRDIAVKTGLTLTQINESMTYQDGFNISHSINQNGDTVEITKTPRYRVRDNRYSFLDIPVMLSYTWRKDRFFFDFNSGLNLNLYAHQTGSFFDLKEKVSTFEESETYPFRRFAGLSLLMSGTVGYYLGFNTSIFVEPGVRYFTNTLSKKDYPVKQKYVNYRMNIGVRYRFTGGKK